MDLKLGRGKLRRHLYMGCRRDGKALVSALKWLFRQDTNMDSWTFNKIAGAVLGTCLMVLGLQNISAGVYKPELPAADKQGFLIEVAAAEEPAAGAGGEAAAVSLGTLLASADATKGATVAKTCAACHDFTKGGPNKVGPNLYEVVERGIGSHEGYAYSEAMLGHKADKWSYDNLDVYLKAPKKYVVGTKMAFGGIGNEKKRADLIAYLASLSDAPKPFPAP
jgi:cytochrome c